MVASRTRDIGNREERDRAAETVLGDSMVGHAIERVRAMIALAWDWSVVAGAINRAVSTVQVMAVADRVRVVSGIALAAAVTTLALQPLAGRPASLVWIVPSIVAIVSATALLALRGFAKNT